MRFLWNESALVVLFELSAGGRNVHESRPISTERAKLYEEDCVELFSPWSIASSVRSSSRPGWRRPR